MSQFNTTELDFDQIKENLISYFKRQDGPYRDYDFTGSGLANLIDILAYNTHYNAVNAHMAMNESFLDSAQVRGNVVSRAKLLGYTPKSVTAPSALVRAVFKRSPQAGEEVTSFTLPKGSQFVANVDETTYIFETTEAQTAQLGANSTEFIFEDLLIKQGTTRVENYAVDNSYDQRFVINSQKVDTKTLDVQVFPTLQAIETQADQYTLFTDFPNIDGQSRIYYVDENSDGNFEIRFGNDIFGRRPEATGLVRLTYLISEGPATNGARTFKFKPNQPGTQNIDGGSAVITTKSPAAGGAIAESIDSIKYNAPLSFIAQERAVTSDDYKSLIMKNFTGIDTVSAWGGETEPQPQFGKVFISVKPTAAEYLTSLQKTDILNLLNDKSVVGIQPEIVDADYTYIYYQLNFKYDPSITSAGANGLASIIKNTLSEYNRQNLNNFAGVYRHSNLLTQVDNTSDAILNSAARVFCYKNVAITTTTQDTHRAEFDFQLDGDINQAHSFISTSFIQIAGQNVQLADEPIPGDVEKRRVYSFKTDAQGRVVRINSSVGFVYPQTGLVDLNNLENDLNETLKIRVRPASDDIISRRRKILQIDLNETTITGDVDTTSVSGSSRIDTYRTFNRD